jgi:ABC-2 type transport system permease protein
MLADAVAAETYKFLRQKGGLFWGFCAVPLAVLAFNLALDTWIGTRSPVPVALDLGRQVLNALALGGNNLFQIFFIAGAVAIFSGEYRWETWRLLTPRNSRANLLTAKFIVYAVLTALSLLALGLAGAAHTVYAAILGAQITLPGATFPLQAMATLLASWGELLVLGFVAALIATLTRAMIGPLIATISFTFAQSMAMLVLGGATAKLHWFAVFPGLSAWYVRAWITGAEIAPGIFPETARALPAALFVLCWIGLLAAAALAAFQRQDLTRE